MLLAIDIGNTNISFGIFKGDNVRERFDILTKFYSLKKLKKSLNKIDIGDAVICSVVPDATRLLTEDLKICLAKRPYIIGKEIIVPIRNLYRNPKQVGQDRLVNAYAGSKLYGSPLIIVDFGTAVTFDIVSGNTEYLGGMILPGLGISLDALAERTALLPKLKLEKPKELIGRDTKNSILGGVVYGFSVLTDSLIEKIKSKLGKNTKVIGTGGNINFMAEYCTQFDIVDINLTLKGLSLIYQTRIERS